MEHSLIMCTARASMVFEFRFASALALVGFLALAGQSAVFEKNSWQSISMTYVYQFTLGLKSETDYSTDWRRLGLKKARVITLQEHVKKSAKPGNKQTRLRKLQK